MKQTRVRRSVCLCALLLALLLPAVLVPTAQAAPERQTVRVGFFAFDGYHMMDEQGTRSGYGYDFLRLASRYVDVDYEYIGYEAGWDDMLRMLKQGEIDMVTSANMTEDRLEDFAFTNSIGTSSAMLTVDIRNNGIAAGEYETYNGMRVGLLAGSSRNDDLAAFAREHGFTYTPVYFLRASELEAALHADVVDAILTSSLRRTQSERTLDLFATRDFFVMMRKSDTELLEKMNYAIDQINAAEGDWKNDLQNKYYTHYEEKDLAFTREEQALIQRYASGEEKLVVSACTDKRPYAYEEDGEACGIMFDYFARLAQYIGIPYEVVLPADREEYIELCESGQIDICLDGRFQNESQAELLRRTVSAPYTTMRLAVVTRRDFGGEIRRLAVSGAQGIFGIEDGLASHAERIEVPTREAGMQAVLDGKADATFVYFYTAQQFVNHDERGLLTYTILTEPSYDYQLAFSENVSHELAGIFTKAIYAMPDDLFDKVASQYTSYRAEDVELMTWIEIYPLPTILVCLSFFLVLSFALVLSMRQKSVRAEKERALELHALAEQTARATQAKSDFLANVSHDLRTPMNAIVGIADLMEREPDTSDRIRSYIRKIQNSSHHLLRLIDDVLDMRGIEEIKLSLHAEPSHLTEQVRQVEDIIRVTAEERAQTFEVHLRSLTHDAVLADGARLRQILLNLLSNAVKYTPDGGKIALDVEELPCETAGSARFRFRVSDNGCGMTPELLKHAFEPFVRSEASVTNKIPGTGLGLPITKNLVEVMGGEISVSSVPGEGTCFEVTLTLSIAQTEAEAAADSASSVLRGKRFLCAEDNELNAEILQEILAGYGASCSVFSDGEQLVRAFESIAPGEYDAILMDIQMPNMNGLEAARAVRAGRNPLGASIPIIAMTANAFEEDVRSCLEAGMNAHISKPISAGAIARAVAGLCPQTAEQDSRP